ncbi:Threonine dehydratase biosynthetic, chloroplastic [Datura stramonium]|uniref:Threonine dehydratase biosynthetic, chloroplastic n=1 Tax=Datura stramonium TaxID=4076 RepID=A0ABS8VB28_DATST|nr:Threonine dehydratase biosynthetic, chloroplastic [Datura stramonium]
MNAPGQPLPSFRSDAATRRKGKSKRSRVKTCYHFVTGGGLTEAEPVQISPLQAPFLSDRTLFPVVHPSSLQCEKPRRNGGFWLNLELMLLEKPGALTLAGAEAYCKYYGLKGENIVAVTSGANMKFNRLRFVTELCW